MASGSCQSYKGGAVAQGAGLAIQQRNKMPRLKIADIAGEAALVLGNDILARHQHDPARIGAQGDMLAGKLGRHAVAIAGILNQAGGTDPHRLFHIAVKSPPQGAQLGALIFKNLCNRAGRLFRVGAICQFLAAQAQPVVQPVQIIKGWHGSKQSAS